MSNTTKEELKLNQELYYADIKNFTVIKHIIIGIYTLDKVKQDSDKYFFDSRNQLVATISEKEPEYDIFCLTGIIKGPIQQYKFKPLSDVFDKYFLNRDDAENYVKLQHKLYLDDEYKCNNKKIDDMLQEVHRLINNNKKEEL